MVSLRIWHRPREESLAPFPEHSESSPLSVHDLTVAYHERPVLWNVDYDAPSSGLVAIVGPNGAGKTTLLKGALGLLPTASGTVEFWGRPYEEMKKYIAYVPQRESVDWDFPVSAIEVVIMGRYGSLGWFRQPKKEDWDRAHHALSQVGLADFADRQINQLSGGQQQRVFLARALVQEAKLYLMDEPFAGVDATTEKVIVKLLGNLRDNNKVVICVHHDLLTVPDYFDNVLLLNTRVIAAGATETAFTDENLKKTYGGRLTLLDEVGEELRKATT